MELLIYFLAFISTMLIIIIGYEFIFYEKELLKQRLDNLKGITEGNLEEDELKRPFIHRIIKPVYQRIVKAVGNITPKAIKDKYNSLIKTSGSSQKTTVNNVLMIQLMMGFVSSGLLYILIKYSYAEINLVRVIITGVLGFFMPVVRLYNKAAKRKEKIRRSLPDLLDMVYVSVEAGLGFDAALKKTSEKMKGPLSDDILKSMNEISKGKDREEALKELISRTGVDDISSFVRAVIQTEKLGSNIANMLKIQSVTMRQKRRQRAEEKAAKIPVIMLFPLIFLMFPAMFVVILGPAVIKIFQNTAFIH